MNRLIGEYGNDKHQTLIICLAGVHGNEPLGVEALERVLADLQKNNPSFEGKVVAIRGNLTALKKNKRYIQEDLNRIWSDDNIQSVRQHIEIQEMQEIYEVISQTEFQHYTQKIFIDLHTTSAKNGTFIVSTNYEQANYIIQNLEAPVIKGLASKLKNTAMEYMQRQGFVSFAFEGGQHESEKAVNNMEWCVWQTFVLANCLGKKDIPQKVADYRHLQQIMQNIPKELTLQYLHEIEKEDNFVMRAGFKNFDKISKGQILAEDKNGQIMTQSDGYILMPLYQPEGNEGFFIVS